MRHDTEIYWSLGLIPVQEWIAEARRSRDLLMGSKLLSWLMARLLARLDDLGAEILVPYTRDGDVASLAGSRLADTLAAGSYSLPNRATGRFGGTLSQLASHLKTLETQIVAPAWAEVVADATRRDPFPPRYGGAAWGELEPWLDPVRCPIQLVWCARPVEGVRGLRAIDELFAAVKRTRPVPPHTGHPVGKCDQCARREALGGEAWRPWRQFHSELSRLPEIEAGYRLEPGERLCSVCTVKRLTAYLSRKDSPSTSTIAASEWLDRIRSVDDLKALLRILEDRAKKVPGFDEPTSDPSPLYFRRTVDRLLARARAESRAAGADEPERQSALEERRETLERVSAALAELTQEIEDHNRRITAGGENGANDLIARDAPSYLAVLTFDGDDMGELVQRHHAWISPRIRDVADRLSGVIAEHRAAAFYLGGDEGLLLCPLERVLDLAHALRSTWAEAMAPDGEDGAPETAPTLSIGVAVFDRERPLGPAIEAAHQAIETAKARDGKDALAVTVQTASGSRWTSVHGWGEEWDRVRAAVELIRAGELSAGWPHKVESFLRELPAGAWAEGESVRDAIREEVKRRTLRSLRLAPVQGGPPDAAARRLAKGTLWEGRLLGESWWRSQPESPETLAEPLHLVAFLAREGGGVARDTETGSAGEGS